jgi:hypothetical protein
MEIADEDERIFISATKMHSVRDIVPSRRISSHLDYQKTFSSRVACRLAFGCAPSISQLRTASTECEARAAAGVKTQTPPFEGGGAAGFKAVGVFSGKARSRPGPVRLSELPKSATVDLGGFLQEMRPNRESGAQ